MVTAAFCCTGAAASWVGNSTCCNDEPLPVATFGIGVYHDSIKCILNSVLFSNSHGVGF